MEFLLSYDAGSITVLEGLEAVRKRPGMYIGSTGERGLHHLVYEVVDNSVDEALAGAEVVHTPLHAGGKFDSKSYAVSGGLHGVGVSVVNALSARLEVEVRREGYAWTQVYERGDPMGPLERGAASDETGTTITFRPDGQIFETTDWSFETLSRRMQEMAFLNKNLAISLTDLRTLDESGQPRAARYQYEGGIADFVRYINASKEPVHGSIVDFGEDGDGISVEIAMQWTGAYTESVHTFANTINTTEGGTHEEGFRAALTTIVNRYAREQKLLREKEENLTGDDVREGLTAIVSVKLAEPQFEGQTKTKLGNTEAKSFVQKACNDWLGSWFERNPREGKVIVQKSASAAQAR